MTDVSGAVRARRHSARSQPNAIEVLSCRDGQDRQYTFAPADVSETERLTRWITVDSEGTVDLSAWR